MKKKIVILAIVICSTAMFGESVKVTNGSVKVKSGNTNIEVNVGNSKYEEESRDSYQEDKEIKDKKIPDCALRFGIFS